MGFKVIKKFRCKGTNKQYCPGDNYNIENKKEAAKLLRAGYLAKGSPKIETATAPDNTEKAIIKHVGGGWYQLPSGEKVQGKEEAERRIKAGD